MKNRRKSKEKPMERKVLVEGIALSAINLELTKLHSEGNLQNLRVVTAVNHLTKYKLKHSRCRMTLLKMNLRVSQISSIMI